MKIKIHRPKLLVATLLVVAGVSSVAVLWAEERGPAPLPAIPVAEGMTDDEKRGAADIIEVSGIVESVNGNQEWEVEASYDSSLPNRDGALVKVVWDNPVSHSGPWSSIHCRGAIKRVGTRTFSNVKTLAVYVDQRANEVVGYVPAAPEPGQAGTVAAASDETSNIKFYDLRTDAMVYDGTVGDADFECPSGFRTD
jgi:hypothetical protein